MLRRFAGALLLMPPLAACARPTPLCARAPDASFAYPAGDEGGVLAAYVRAYDSGDADAMRAFREQHGSASAAPVPEDAARDKYAQMSGTLGCITPAAVSRRDGATVLLVATEREGFYELAFAFDGAGRVTNVRGSPAMPPGENEPASIEAALTSVDALTRKLAGEDRFSGVVLVAHHGHPIFGRAVGLANRERGIATRMETRFDIGSVGKMFTGVAIAQLVDAGKLRYGETLGEVIPDYPLADARAITLHQLLTHTSGLGDVTGFLDATPPLRTPQDFIARFGEEPLAFPPGQGHAYSNFGFAVLGRVVEVASGEPYDAYLHERVFVPAGMNEIGPPADPSLAAVPYSRREEVGSHGERRDATAFVPPPAPFGCELASASDLVRFGEALFGGKLVKSETARFITSAREKGDAYNPPGAKTLERGYGYGFGEDHFGSVRVVAHDGGTFGVSATLAFLPDAGVTLVVLANDDPPAAPRISARALKVIAYAIGHESPALSQPPPVPVTPPPPTTHEDAECVKDADCKLMRVYSCGEILNCTASCPGGGHDVALPVGAANPEMPQCGPQPPCTPVCPPSPPVLPGTTPPPAPHAACVDAKCVVSP